MTIEEAEDLRAISGAISGKTGAVNLVIRVIPWPQKNGTAIWAKSGRICASSPWALTLAEMTRIIPASGGDMIRLRQE